MAQRLAREQAFERLVERGFATCAHDIAQFDLLVMAQAAIDRPGRGNTDAIAPGAEIVAERSDEAVLPLTASCYVSHNPQ